MNLIEVLLPDPKDFFIFNKDRQKAYIMGYNHINIDFLPQISYVNGERRETEQPTIYYTIYMENIEKTKLASLFNREFRDIWQTKDCYIGINSKTKRIVGTNEYIFKGKISAIPSFLETDAFYSPSTPRSKEIKVSLCLDNVGIASLYEEINESYEEYYTTNEIDRFELMDFTK